MDLGGHKAEMRRADLEREQATNARLLEVRDELQRAQIWPPFNSLHEAYGVLLEEVEEFWTHVKTNQKRRDLDAARLELVQIAAMAIRGIECIDLGRGRV
jgi:glycyl-tRNA synthetase beta subunit